MRIEGLGMHKGCTDVYKYRLMAEWSGYFGGRYFNEIIRLAKKCEDDFPEFYLKLEKEEAKRLMKEWNIKKYDKPELY